MGLNNFEIHYMKFSNIVLISAWCGEGLTNLHSISGTISTRWLLEEDKFFGIVVTSRMTPWQCIYMDNTD